MLTFLNSLQQEPQSFEYLIYITPVFDRQSVCAIDNHLRKQRGLVISRKMSKRIIETIFRDNVKRYCTIYFLQKYVYVKLCSTRYTEIRTAMFINIFETLHHLFFLFAVLNLYIYILTKRVVFVLNSGNSEIEILAATPLSSDSKFANIRGEPR